MGNEGSTMGSTATDAGAVLSANDATLATTATADRSSNTLSAAPASPSAYPAAITLPLTRSGPAVSSAASATSSGGYGHSPAARVLSAPPSYT